MTQQLKIKDWLENFLRQRGLDRPDGRPLFAYHTTPDEFHTLEDGLRENIALACQLGGEPFELWKNVPQFNAWSCPR